MSEEKNKDMEKFQIKLGKNPLYTETEIELLNLIEKQQKEIENLKQIEEEHKKENGKLREEIHIERELAEALITYDMNEMWKQKIQDKIIERKFELQQEYKEFEDDEILQAYEELLEEE